MRNQGVASKTARIRFDASDRGKTVIKTSSNTIQMRNHPNVAKIPRFQFKKPENRYILARQQTARDADSETNS
jgi:hypothetical protein